jgi:hypothetical protein
MARLVSFVFLVGLIGCGGPETLKDPVEISGTLKTPDGKPVPDVLVSFSPTTVNGSSAGFKTDDKGEFKGKVIPGSYIWLIGPSTDDEKKAEAAMKGVPEKYRKTTDASDRSVSISSGDTLNLVMSP